VNSYGARARQHWQTSLPDRYSQIPDPEMYFARVGEEIAEQVDLQARAIAGDDPADEPYLTRVGRLTEARMAAEQQVLAEMLPDPEQQYPEPVHPEQTAIA
jgi:hypothetical protein